MYRVQAAVEGGAVDVEDLHQLRIQELYRRAQVEPTAELFREYVTFGLEHEGILDPLMIGFGLAQAGQHWRTIHFEKLSEPARDFVSRRKLWDFMEDVPLDETPRDVCKTILLELMEKVKNN